MLKKFNNLVNQIIYQYSCIQQSTINKKSQNTYIVKKGDSLSKIAGFLKVSVNDLCQINNIKDKNKIFIGQVLKIPNIKINTTNKKNYFNDSSITEQDYKKIYFIARVLYSETGTKTTDQQILKVASVIYNRSKNKKAFPKTTDIFSVVSNKTQFSCINDPKNSNWKQFKPALNNRTKNAMNIAYKLYKGTFQPIDKNMSENKKYYMYIDHSLAEVPQNFYSKKYWDLINLPQTQHFKFYSLQQKKA